MTKIHVVTGHNRHLYEDVLEQSFRLRHEIFVQERGWKTLSRPDGRDVDAYDGGEAIYLLALDEGKIVGGQRLFPTTRPHMLSEVFPHLASAKGIPSSPDIFEWTRYFVIKQRRTGRTDCRLLAAVQEFALEQGITQLTAVVEMWWLPRFQEAGFKARPLGLPQLVENAWTVAVQIDVSLDTLLQTLKLGGIHGSVLERQKIPRPGVGIPLVKPFLEDGDE